MARPRRTITVDTLHPRLTFPAAEARRTLATALNVRNPAARWIAVVFVTSRFIHAMNRRFLGHDYITDIITFQYDDEQAVDAELYINLDRAKSQAADAGVSYAAEVRRLLIHGVLHLSGMSDATDAERAAMHAEEDRILELLAKRKH